MEEEGLAAPRRRLSPEGGPLGLQLAWGSCPLGENGCERDSVLRGCSEGDQEVKDGLN